MALKEVTNSQLLKEIRDVKKAVLINTTGINRNGKRINELFKLVFSLDKIVTTLEEKLVLFPEFFNKVDALAGEIIENRQEKAFTVARIDDHEKRITTLESR